MRDLQTYYSPRYILSDFLDTVGDESGVLNFNGDYSGGVIRAKIVPPAGYFYQINRVLGVISGAGPFDSGKYGGNIILTNGIYPGISAWINELNNGDGALFDRKFAQGIYTNTDWAIFCFDTQHSSFGQGDEYFIFKWAFSEHGGEGDRPMCLDGDKGESLFVELHDDFTGLSKHQFLAQGFKVKK